MSLMCHEHVTPPHDSHRQTLSQLPHGIAFQNNQHVAVTFAYVDWCPNNNDAAFHRPALSKFLHLGSKYARDSLILSNFVLDTCFVNTYASCSSFGVLCTFNRHCLTPTPCALQHVSTVILGQISVKSHVHSNCPSRSPICLRHLRVLPASSSHTFPCTKSFVITYVSASAGINEIGAFDALQWVLSILQHPA